MLYSIHKGKESHGFSLNYRDGRMQVKEKRQFPRINLKTTFSWQIRGANRASNTISNDISLGGLGFVHEKFIAPETPIGLEINILSRIINPFGRIAWTSPLPHSNRYRVGIEFIEFNPVEKNFLSDYIDLRLNKI